MKDKQEQGTISNFTPKELTIMELTNAVKILEEAKSSKIELEKSLLQIIGYLASKTGKKVYETPYLPKNCIYIGTGKNPIIPF